MFPSNLANKGKMVFVRRYLQNSKKAERKLSSRDQAKAEQTKMGFLLSNFCFQWRCKILCFHLNKCCWLCYLFWHLKIRLLHPIATSQHTCFVGKSHMHAQSFPLFGLFSPCFLSSLKKSLCNMVMLFSFYCMNFSFLNLQRQRKKKRRSQQLLSSFNCSHKKKTQKFLQHLFFGKKKINIYTVWLFYCYMKQHWKR